MKKVVLFAFSGDPAAFAHAMLTAMDMKDRGYDIKVVIEGDATKLLSLLRNETKPFADVYRRFRDRGLPACTCAAPPEFQASLLLQFVPGIEPNFSSPAGPAFASTCSAPA